MTSKIRARAGTWAGICVSAILIAAIFGVVGATFRSGVDRGVVAKLVPSGYGTFYYAVCAILAQEKYRAGRYVCANSAQKQMTDAGLWWDDAAAGRLGKTLSQWLADGASLDKGLQQVFASAPLPSDGGVYTFGWGVDSGYMDFAELAFRLFGDRVEAFYYGYFLLLTMSVCLFCIQFWRNYFALFAVLAFQVSVFQYLDILPMVGLDALSSHRALSFLAIVPMFHALFLIIYRMRITVWTALLFAPQAVLTAAAADFRSLACAAVIALVVCCIALLIVERRSLTLRQAAWRCWPAYAMLVCLAGGAVLQAATADPRIPLIGGMRYHTFWEPLFYNLQLHPDWQRKYGAQFHGASGDATTEVAVQSYRQRHSLLHVKDDFVRGDETQGITKVAYEKYTRAAYLEFVRNDPWFVIQLKYYNALNVVDFAWNVLRVEWAALDWRFIALAALVAIALMLQSWRNAESSERMMKAAGLLVLSGIVMALPIWATVPSANLMMDYSFVSVSASFVLALCMIVWLATLSAERLLLPSASWKQS